MNTRLQVEHPVTEAVTGIDLVELQIRVAAGEKLPFKQDDIERRGHAIEMRINAEDPSGGVFRPTPGAITKFRHADGLGVRFDSGFTEGDTVSQFYDNLVGKLIVWGPNREMARRKALRALSEMEIEGIHTTIPAHQVVLADADFIDAKHSTTWVETKLDLSKLKVTQEAPVDTEGAARIPRDVDIEVNGRRFQVKLWVPEGGPSIAARAEALLKKAQRKPSGSTGGGSSAAASGTVTVPMQGTVLRLLVKDGDKVEVGQTLCVLEAMKMENNINAESAGTVRELRVKEGSTVGPGDTICTIS